MGTWYKSTKNLYWLPAVVYWWVVPAYSRHAGNDDIVESHTFVLWPDIGIPFGILLAERGYSKTGIFSYIEVRDRQAFLGSHKKTNLKARTPGFKLTLGIVCSWVPPSPLRRCTCGLPWSCCWGRNCPTKSGCPRLGWQPTRESTPCWTGRRKRNLETFW